MPCGSPPFDDAACSGPVSLPISGNPKGASASCSSMNRLRSPRAYRPVNARVTTVSVKCGSCKAARWTGLVPASWASRNAVPSCAATAPALITPFTSSDVARPPAATMGASRRAVRAASSTASGWQAGCATGSNVARCPPADGPWATSAPSPRANAISASRTVVTVATVVMPAFCRRLHSPIVGRPNVKDTASGRRSCTTSSFAAQSSSS